MIPSSAIQFDDRDHVVDQSQTHGLASLRSVDTGP